MNLRTRECSFYLVCHVTVHRVKMIRQLFCVMVNFADVIDLHSFHWHFAIACHCYLLFDLNFAVRCHVHFQIILKITLLLELSYFHSVCVSDPSVASLSLLPPSI